MVNRVVNFVYNSVPSGQFSCRTAHVLVAINVFTQYPFHIEVLVTVLFHDNKVDQARLYAMTQAALVWEQLDHGRMQSFRKLYTVNKPTREVSVSDAYQT
jgi:hypothetical protein